MTRERALRLAEEWIAAWNAHDLERILEHYEDEVELISPVAAKLLARADGKVIGKSDLCSYFRKGLEAYPGLRFKLLEVFYGVNSVVLHYENHRGRRTAEFMEISPNGKVSRVVANYND